MTCPQSSTSPLLRCYSNGSLLGEGWPRGSCFQVSLLISRRSESGAKLISIISGLRDRHRSRRVRVPVRHEGSDREIWVQGGDVLRGKSGASNCALGECQGETFIVYWSL